MKTTAAVKCLDQFVTNKTTGARKKVVVVSKLVVSSW
jgi:hypothetical protein